MRTLKIASLLLALAAGIGLSRGLRADDQPPASAPRKAVVTILHTNDWHGNAFATRRGNKASEPLTGGVVACAEMVAKVRAERPGAVLVLDAGDLISGHPAASFVDNGVTGTAFVQLWSTIGFDAWTIGNHDLDHGVASMLALVSASATPVVSANLFTPDGKSPLVPGSTPYKVFTVDGVKVGVIGYTTDDLPRLLPKGIVEKVEARGAVTATAEVLPPTATAAALVKKLREEEHCDLVIALTHLGVEFDQALAKAVPGFDAIVGGHSHTRLTKPVMEGSTVIVQAGAKGREMGRLDLTIEGGKVTSHEYKLLTLPYDEASAPKLAAERNAALLAREKTLDDEILGTTVKALKRGNYYGPSDCGSFIADSIRLSAGADVGFINSGGVRADFPEGKVTRATLMTVMPFDDELGTFQATGEELQRICLHNAAAAVTHDHGILQVSGLRYKWAKKSGTHAKNAPDAEVAEIEEVTIGGKPLDKSKTYSCATNEFLLYEQAVKYFGYEPPSRAKFTKSIVESLVDALKAGPIEQPDHGRIREVDQQGSEKEPAPADGEGK